MPRTLLDWLIEHYPTAKRQTFKRMLEAGRISVNGTGPRTLKHEISDADQILIGDRPAAKFAAPAPFPIVYEDADVLVINKPTGLLTSTVPREPRPTALALVREYVLNREPRARVGLIHRLDRDASGLLVFSKTDPAYQSLKTQFFKHTVDRVYTAIVHGRPKQPAARIESRLIELADGTVRTTRVHAKGQEAVTDYETVSTTKHSSVLRVTLQTGRKHQIRTHLASQGMPIVNDAVYGEKLPEGRLMLAAVELAFDHPRTGKRVSLRIELPEEMKPQMNTDEHR